MRALLGLCQSCPTGVLSFGRFDGNGGVIYDQLQASPVRMQEQHTLSPVDQLFAEAKR